jgi:hypothetical protein
MPARRALTQLRSAGLLSTLCWKTTSEEGVSTITIAVARIDSRQQTAEREKRRGDSKDEKRKKRKERADREERRYSSPRCRCCDRCGMCAA